MTKQTIIRILIVVLVLALAAVVLVTCSNSGAQAPQATSAPTAAAAAPAAPAAEAAGGQVATGAVTTAANTGPGAGSAAAAAAGSTPFVIDQASSEARFLINETLIGIPTEVKGVTSQITGTLAIDTADPTKTTLSTITIDARDLRTDRDLRNRAIRRFILESNKDEYRFITFTPTAITGLPAKAGAGDSFNFQITGDLKIKDVSKPVTFDVEVKADSASEITGLAKATVKRSDFNLSIPSAPGVADVTDDVQLELAFTAKAGQG
ncbi:MAG: YceI family protein [Caldilineaceae bacterium]